MQTHEKETLKNTAIFSSLTVLSRIFGLARDMLKAYAFGTSMYSVAFDVAFRLPNMLRNLVAEGALSQAFLPLYEKYRQKGIQEAHKAAGSVVLFVFFSLGSLCTVVVILSPYLLPWLIGQENFEKTTLIIQLTQILFPYILLMSLAAIYMAIEFSHNIFWSPSFGPALLNLVVIVFFGGYLILAKIFFWPQDGKSLIFIFAFVTLLAGFAQVVFQISMTYRYKIAPNLKAPVKHKILKELFTMMLPAVLGAAVHEIGQLIDIYLAMFIEARVAGAVSALTYAHRLIHLPMGVFGVALSTAALPQLSRFYVQGLKKEFSENLWFSIRANVFLITPAILGLIVFAEPIVGFLFERGEFQKNSTQITAFALQFYAPGILAFSLQKLFSSSFYAQHNTKIPAKISIIVLILNFVLALIFMNFLDHGGLALGSSLSAYLGILLYAYEYRRKGFLVKTPSWSLILPTLYVNFIFFLFLLLLKTFLEKYSYLSQIFLAIPLSLLAYWALVKYINLAEVQLIEDLYRGLRKRFF